METSTITFYLLGDNEKREIISVNIMNLIFINRTEFLARFTIMFLFI